MEYKYTLGSLFDGSGGFPLSGLLCGIEPKWASEIEPYPIAVTKQHFPSMKHLGDISKINGAEVEPVDIITFGSPCQDLSVAGKRAGLKHEANGDEETTRSGLFMEAVRIIKEMRIATNGKYPRFALWENVLGAFSSNKGEDFRVVCEELIKIVEPRASMPEVPKNGWAYADSYIGDGWSLAYRTFDAQYWGVPQRRRRIHLIADFSGECAREILFEREGVRGYFTQGRTPWQTAPANAEGRPGADDSKGESGGGLLIPSDSGYPDGLLGDRGLDAVALAPVASTLRAGAGAPKHVQDFVGRLVIEAPACVYSVENHPADSRVNIDDSGKVQCLTGRMGTGGGNVPMAMAPVVFDGSNVTSPTNASNPQIGDPCHTLSTDSRNYAVYCLQGNGIDRADTAGCNGKGWREDASYTLNTLDRPAVVYAVDQGGGKSSANVQENKAPTLCTTHGGEPAVAYQNKVGALCHRDYKGVGSQYVDEGKLVVEKEPRLVAYPTELHDFIAEHNADVPHQQEQLQTADGVARPLVAATHGAASHHTKTVIYEHPRYIVRRLTPTECARLQGFADQWGHIEKKDSLTDEELSFWQGVRDTYALINDKEPKAYTEKQILTWYNKLHTDSAEYKMWGNGIALPPALYCMQGIVDALEKEGR